MNVPIPNIAEAEAAAEAWGDPEHEASAFDRSEFDDLRLLARFVLAVLSAPGMTAEDIGCIERLIEGADDESTAVVKVGFLRELIADALRLRAITEPIPDRMVLVSGEELERLRGAY